MTWIYNLFQNSKTVLKTTIQPYLIVLKGVFWTPSKVGKNAHFCKFSIILLAPEYMNISEFAFVKFSLTKRVSIIPSNSVTTRLSQSESEKNY